MSDQPTIVLATEISAAWLANPHTRASAAQVQALLASVCVTVDGMLAAPVRAAAATPAEPSARPAVGAKASLKIVGRIVSMLDGKPYASLMRHLKANGLTPEAYRQRFNLPSSYPMVAPAYSETRRAIAKSAGLGRKASAGVAATAQDAAPRTKARKGVSEAKKAAQAHLAGDR